MQNAGSGVLANAQDAAQDRLSRACGGSPGATCVFRYSRAGSLNTAARCHARNSGCGRQSLPCGWIRPAPWCASSFALVSSPPIDVEVAAEHDLVIPRQHGERAEVEDLVVEGTKREAHLHHVRPARLEPLDVRGFQPQTLPPIRGRPCVAADAAELAERLSCRYQLRGNSADALALCQSCPGQFHAFVETSAVIKNFKRRESFS